MPCELGGGGGGGGGIFAVGGLGGVRCPAPLAEVFWGGPPGSPDFSSRFPDFESSGIFWLLLTLFTAGGPPGPGPAEAVLLCGGGGPTPGLNSEPNMFEIGL